MGMSNYSMSLLGVAFNRLAYPVWMLDSIISAHAGSGSKLFVMYDIACSLSKHLQV